MSRFSNLEFDGEQEASKPSHASLKDELSYLGEADASFGRGQFEQALRAYAKALEFNPQSSRAWAGQVRMLIELGEFQEAKLWADKAMEQLADDPELLAAKAVALARCGDLKAALAFSDAAIEAQSDLPYVWLARGDVLLARSEKRADYCLEKALSCAPGSWLILWLACRIYYFYRQFARAFKLAQQALNLDASQPALWLQTGRCQLALGLAGAAENSFEQARQLDPQCQPGREEASAVTQPGFWTRVRGCWRRLSGS